MDSPAYIDRLPAELLDAILTAVVQAVHNLCKVSKERQAEAASAGITPVLTHYVDRNRHGAAAAIKRASTSPPGQASAADVAESPVASKIRALCISLPCALASGDSLRCQLLRG